MTGSTAAAPEPFYGGDASGPNSYRQDAGYPTVPYDANYDRHTAPQGLEHVPGVHNDGFPHVEPGAQGAYNQTSYGRTTNF